MGKSWRKGAMLRAGWSGNWRRAWGNNAVVIVRRYRPGTRVKEEILKNMK
jgi:hypothetical protein